MKPHHSSLLACAFIKPLLGDIKVVNAYTTDGGHHTSFVYKGNCYTMDIKVFRPKIKFHEVLTIDEVLEKGGYDDGK